MKALKIAFNLIIKFSILIALLVGAFKAASLTNYVSYILIFSYFYFGQIYIKSLSNFLWFYILPPREKRVGQKLTFTLGVVEQFIYAASFIFNAWNFIGIWLGLKIAQRLLKYTNDHAYSIDVILLKKKIEDGAYTIQTEEKEKLNIELREANDKVTREDGEKRNAYFIGNLASLILGLSLGFLLKIVLYKQGLLDTCNINKDSFTKLFL